MKNKKDRILPILVSWVLIYIAAIIFGADFNAFKWTFVVRLVTFILLIATDFYIFFKEDY